MRHLSTPVSAIPKKRVPWKDRFKTVILAQLRQGITPHKVALSVALGATIGLFPIIGVTTLACLGVGAWLRLNQPLLQLANYAAFPLQLCLLYGFLRTGEWITFSEPITLSAGELIALLKESPSTFFKDFGMSGLRTILGWAVISPFIMVVFYFALIPILRNLMRNYRIVAQKKKSAVSPGEVA